MTEQVKLSAASETLPPDGSSASLSKLDRPMKHLLFLVFCVFQNTLALALQQPDSLCLSEEQVFFTCETEHRLVSVCGGKTKRGDYIQLRFGQPGKLEASWPPTEDKNRGISKGMVIGQGAFGFYVRFSLTKQSYFVYEIPGVSGGLVMVESSKVRLKELCRTVRPSRLRDIPAKTGSVFAVSGD